MEENCILARWEVGEIACGCEEEVQSCLMPIRNVCIECTLRKYLGFCINRDVTVCNSRLKLGGVTSCVPLFCQSIMSARVAASSQVI